MQRTRTLILKLSSPDMTPHELEQLAEQLNSMVDWQLAGERDEGIQDFIIQASRDTVSWRSSPLRRQLDQVMLE